MLNFFGGDFSSNKMGTFFELFSLGNEVEKCYNQSLYVIKFVATEPKAKPSCYCIVLSFLPMMRYNLN